MTTHWFGADVPWNSRPVCGADLARPPELMSGWDSNEPHPVYCARCCVELETAYGITNDQHADIYGPTRIRIIKVSNQLCWERPVQPEMVVKPYGWRLPND